MLGAGAGGGAHLEGGGKWLLGLLWCMRTVFCVGAVVLEACVVWGLVWGKVVLYVGLYHVFELLHVSCIL